MLVSGQISPQGVSTSDKKPPGRFGSTGLFRFRLSLVRSVPLLEFVRVEPYVIPKRSLTGGNTERVDTRVLQVIYVVAAPDPPLYVGQQLDVSLDAGGK